MTDYEISREMTDNEIIKALECCTMNSCDGCPIDKFKVLGTGNCISEILTAALNLINRQKAEIERLEQNINGIDIVSRNHIKVIRTQAIKEFAERLKKERLIDRGYEILSEGTIDNLVKEMEEVTKNDRA